MFLSRFLANTKEEAAPISTQLRFPFYGINVETRLLKKS